MENSFARYRPYLAMFALFVSVMAGTIFFLRRPEPPAAVTITTATPRATATAASIIVDVRGAVNKPGVYTLPVGSRVQDALARAGDALTNADTRALNLARRLNDGEQIYVPTMGEATPVPPPGSGKTAPTATRVASKINLNTATLAELDTLPGIGPSIGQRIIDYRTQNGDFKTIEDVKKVRGIGDALFNQIKDLITVQ
ncbi:MAG: helix-hairpin-helix domain-containing protein [Anaerolineales bacterium]|nr:helix-hairpin-helix domain-containing protein [Anaerolineales bacterium]